MRDFSLEIVHKQGRGSRGYRNEDSGYTLGSDGDYTTHLSLKEMGEENSLYRSRGAYALSIGTSLLLSKPVEASLKGRQGEAGEFRLRLDGDGLSLLHLVKSKWVTAKKKDLFDILPEDEVNWLAGEVMKKFIFAQSEHTSYLGGDVVVQQDRVHTQNLYIGCRIDEANLSAFLSKEYPGFIINRFGDTPGNNWATAEKN